MGLPVHLQGRLYRLRRRTKPDCLYHWLCIAGLGSAAVTGGAVAIIVHTIPLYRRPTFQGIFGAILAFPSSLAHCSEVLWLIGFLGKQSMSCFKIPSILCAKSQFSLQEMASVYTNTHPSSLHLAMARAKIVA
jgi:hypothetical protein